MIPTSHRHSSKAAAPWGPGFDRLGLPQDGSRSFPWWVARSYLPFSRDDR
jgi:hypothetical protein